MKALNLNEMAALEGGFTWQCGLSIAGGAMFGAYTGFGGGALIAGVGAIPGAIIGAIAGGFAGWGGGC